ncbi:MAG TPA: MarR family transcriptional regulator [Vicinamibacterales bacterium]|jgi:DNA-binding MarR family transcriptional regulator|nr:MarR family transcriptional regulator [Vicinamibacterales bacterium]
MTRRVKPSRKTLARRAWRLMFDFLIRSAPQRARALGRRGLTPNDSRALSSLDTLRGSTMRSLADAWECDASNATWVVDRLESLGLAQRRGVAHDRRVKLVVLTRRGYKTRADLLDEFYAPPAELLELSRPALAALQRALEMLPQPLSKEAQHASELKRRRIR